MFAMLALMASCRRASPSSAVRAARIAPVPRKSMGLHLPRFACVALADELVRGALVAAVGLEGLGGRLAVAQLLQRAPLARQACEPVAACAHARFQLGREVA